MDDDDDRVERRVTFNESLSVRRLIVWQYAAKRARGRYWEDVAIDRMRFARRIRSMEGVLGPVLEGKMKKS